MKKMPWDIIILCLCTTNDNYMMHGSWDMEHNRHIFFVVLDYFLPFYSPNHLPNQNFEKKTKKPPGDIIILLKCTINDNHMMYGSWDMKSNRQNFLSFWAILLIYTKNYDHILYFSWDMTNGRCNINFHFGLFLPFYLLPH